MSTAFPFYLARTAAEFSPGEEPSGACAWMACHFSVYGTGLSNLPETLPPGSMVILNDRIPVHGHDPELILSQLHALTERLRPECILLDFQRPSDPRTARIAAALDGFSGCPLGVSELYAEPLGCPVFLPPPPPDCPPEKWFAPWQGRELWLEAALERTVVTLTEDGAHREALEYAAPPEGCFPAPGLFSRYRIRLTESTAQFHLYRTKEELSALLKKAGALGVTRAVGLYQQLGDYSPFL